MHVGHQTMGNGWQHNNSIYTRLHVCVCTNSLFEFITCCKLSQSNKNLFFYSSYVYMQEIL